MLDELKTRLAKAAAEAYLAQTPVDDLSDDARMGILILAGVPITLRFTPEGIGTLETACICGIQQVDGKYLVAMRG